MLNPLSRLTEFFDYVKRKKPKLSARIKQLSQPQQSEKWATRCLNHYALGEPVIPIIYRISSRIIRQEALPKVGDWLGKKV